MTKEQISAMDIWVNTQLAMAYPREFKHGCTFDYSKKMLERKYKREVLKMDYSFCYLGSYGEKMNKSAYAKKFVVNEISAKKFSITLLEK